MKNKTHFSLWVFDCGVRMDYMSYTFRKHEAWPSFVLNSCKQFQWWKGRDFYGRSRASLSLASPLCVPHLAGTPSTFQWHAEGPSFAYQLCYASYRQYIDLDLYKNTYVVCTLNNMKLQSWHPVSKRLRRPLSVYHLILKRLWLHKAVAILWWNAQETHHWNFSEEPAACFYFSAKLSLLTDKFSLPTHKWTKQSCHIEFHLPSPCVKTSQTSQTVSVASSIGLRLGNFLLLQSWTKAKCVHEVWGCTRKSVSFKI